MKRSVSMKRAVAIAVAAAVAAGTAFAQETEKTITVNGQVGGGVNLVSGSFTEGGDVGAQLRFGMGRINVEGQNSDGTFGGRVRLTWNPVGSFNNSGSGSGFMFGWAWWQPIDMIRVQVGFHDGVWGANQIMGWGFHANDADDFIGQWEAYGFTRNKGVSTGFTDVWGVSLGLTPMEGLTIGVGIPFANQTDIFALQPNTAADVYKHTQAHIRYDLGMGIFALSFKGNSLYHASLFNEETSELQLGFYFTGMEGLKLNFGVTYALPTDGAYTLNDPILGILIPVAVGKLHTPVAIGLGAVYDLSDTIAIKARLGTTFGGSVKPDSGDSFSIPFKLGLNLVPVIDLGILALHLNMGFVYTGAHKDAKDSDFEWAFNPYITKTIGGGTFFAGFEVTANHGEGYNIVNWRIPLGLSYSF